MFFFMKKKKQFDVMTGRSFGKFFVETDTDFALILLNISEYNWSKSE